MSEHTRGEGPETSWDRIQDTVSEIELSRNKYRNALCWAFDRLSLDGGETLKEQKYTMNEIGKVLRGLPSAASNYEPRSWVPSAQLKQRDA
jgi:hypothetical protein